MAAMLLKQRFVVLRLLSPHPLVCSNGDTALIAAARERHESIVPLLLEHLADVNASDRQRTLSVADNGCNAVDAALCCSAVAPASSSCVQ